MTLKNSLLAPIAGFLITIGSMVSLLSCNDHMYRCERKLYPRIKLANFDTLEIDTLTIVKYYSLHSFDSVIQTKMFFPLDYDYHNNAKDTFFIEGFFRSHPFADGESISNSCFEVQFGNNRVIRFWDFSYNCKEEDPRESGSNMGPGDCLCEFVGCAVSTINCQYNMSKSGIIIRP